jgi:hypothetical protein
VTAAEKAFTFGEGEFTAAEGYFTSGDYAGAAELDVSGVNGEFVVLLEYLLLGQRDRWVCDGRRCPGQGLTRAVAGCRE